MYRVFQKYYFPAKHKKKLFYVWVTLYINKTKKII